jgi:hypothetical protein
VGNQSQVELRCYRPGGVLQLEEGHLAVQLKFFLTFDFDPDQANLTVETLSGYWREYAIPCYPPGIFYFHIGFRFSSGPVTFQNSCRGRCECSLFRFCFFICRDALSLLIVKAHPDASTGLTTKSLGIYFISNQWRSQVTEFSTCFCTAQLIIAA